ncbi:MAG TPA: acyl-CoA dehydrogenase [Actinomycetes bacterium]|nr:acyl-CoA dehydrogenase [Actinomycetes bacterium]
MDFRIPDELTALRESFAAFIEREVRPLEEELRPELVSPTPDRNRIRDAVSATRRASAAAGFYAAYMPEDVGGADLSTLGLTLLVEDAAQSGLRFAMSAVAPPNPAGPTPLLLDLPKHLWDEYVRPVVAAERSMCFALTEPEAGSDAQNIKTRARRDGDGWVIDGHKHFITNADAADFALVFAVTDPAKRANGGITAFVVPRDQYTIGEVQWTMADSHPAQLFFDGARVPGDHVVGEVGRGFITAMCFLDTGRAAIGAQCLGLAEYCLDQAIDHARNRTAFGAPIGRNQAVAFPLARCKVDIEAMRWLTYHLAAAIDDGEHPAADASIVKYHNTERAYEVADRCLQVFGGTGLLKDGPIERVLRWLRMYRVVEGASEIQQLVISRSLGL